MWVLLLIPFGLVVAVLVAIAVRGTVRGKIPTCARCTADWRRFVNLRRGGWATVVLLFSAGMSLDGAGVVWGGALVMLSMFGTPVALVFGFSGDRFRTRGEVSKDRTWIELHRVSEEFAQCIAGALAPIVPVPLQAGPVMAMPGQIGMVTPLPGGPARGA